MSTTFTRRRRTARPRFGLTARAGLIALLVLALLAAGFLPLHMAVRSLRRTQAVAQSDSRLLTLSFLAEKQVLDLETGERGYLLTGEPRFLQPWQAARAGLPGTLRLLRRLVGGSRAELARVASVEAGVRSYISGYSIPLVALGGRDLQAARSPALAIEGKDRLDSIRARFESLDSLSRSELVHEEASVRRSSARAETLAIVVVLGAAVLIIAGVALLSRRITGPIRRLAGLASDVAMGERDVRSREGGPAEIGVLQEAFNRMAEALSAEHRRQALALEDLTAANAEASAVLDSVFEQSPVGLGIYDRELRFVKLNQALADIDGMSIHEHLGRFVWELLPGIDPEVWERMREVIRSGRALVDVELGGGTPAEDGARWWRASFFPISRPDGERVGVGAVISEITTRRRAELERERLIAGERLAATRTALLQRTSAQLAAALSVRRCVQIAIEAAAEAIDCEGALAVILEPGGRPATAETQGFDDAAAAALQELAVSPRVGELLPWTPGLEEVGSAQAPPTLRASGHACYVFVPLSAAAKPLGAIWLALSRAREIEAGERELLTATANQCGQAIDRAQLYEREHEIATTLQRSLLPGRLPAPPQLAVAASYRPASAHNEVGGDFYDLWKLAPDRWMAVVGDVCGKGHHAAALTALARHTLRAEARHQSSPAALLRVLNEAVLTQQTQQRFITVACVLIELGHSRARVTAACAGHPPPLIVAANPDRSRLLGAHGPLAGVLPQAGYSDVVDELESGDMLVLYTDGLLEARAPTHVLTSDDLLAGVREGASSPRRLIAGLERVALDESGHTRDDIAIVALQLRPSPAGEAAGTGGPVPGVAAANPAYRAVGFPALSSAGE